MTQDIHNVAGQLAESLEGPACNHEWRQYMEMFPATRPLESIPPGAVESDYDLPMTLQPFGFFCIHCLERCEQLEDAPPFETSSGQ